MRPIDPCIPLALLPADCRAVVKGAQQADRYDPLPCVQTPGGQVLTRWRLTPEERQRILAGEDLYLRVLTFGEKLQPVSLTVGPRDWSGEA